MALVIWLAYQALIAKCLEVEAQRAAQENQTQPSWPVLLARVPHYKRQAIVKVYPVTGALIGIYPQLMS